MSDNERTLYASQRNPLATLPPYVYDSSWLDKGETCVIPSEHRQRLEEIVLRGIGLSVTEDDFDYPSTEGRPSPYDGKHIYRMSYVGSNTGFQLIYTPDKAVFDEMRDQALRFLKWLENKGAVYYPPRDWR